MMLREFVAFRRERGELATNGKGYDEAGVQLVMLGFMYRIINGGGYVDSEYGVGRHRLDIFIRKPYTGPDGRPALQREVLELKVWWPGASDPLPESLVQLDDYLDRVGLDTGFLTIFDRRPAKKLKRQRGTFSTEITPKGREITLLRV
jgi:hypothetical protein